MSGKRIDRTGQRFGRLVAISRAASTPTRGPRWLFRCDCGVEKIITISNLTKTHEPIKSCGCLHREKAAEIGRRSRTIHGESHLNITPEYRAWADMRHRCQNPNLKCFRNYGARGIRVCERWLKFSNFLADMGRRPGPSYSLDRIDNDGNYEPGNCRWATIKEQAANQRHSNQFLAARHVD